jgi:1-deoxy-D-xylulose-5-phosphate synthase
MAWEALNNIAADKDLPLVVIVNDNERSYAPTKGGLADHLATLRTTRGYEKFLDWGKATLNRTPVVGGVMYEALHGMKKGIKDIVAPQGLFEDLGLKYVGPVDGHDALAVEHALKKAKAYGGPVIVHVITQKGRGYDHALNDEADQMHAVGVINAETGLPFELAGRSWTDEFNDAMVEVGGEREDVVAITAAMMIPVGLKGFADAYPERTFDVGIAEQHAATMAAGLAYAGLHPVVAIYATFLNRAFDQLLMDCALHKAGVTFVLDRSGVTGPDGASHHGMWDMSIAGIVPGLHLAAPRDGQQVPIALRAAVDIDEAPSLIRFPKGTVGDPIVALRTVDGVDVLAEPDTGEVDLLLVGIGSMVVTALAAAEKLTAEGLRVRVVDPVWSLPVPASLVGLAGSARRVAVVEDNSVTGGVGTQVAYAVQRAALDVPVDVFGLPKEFLDHGSRGQVLDLVGLTPDVVANSLRDRLR